MMTNSEFGVRNSELFIEMATLFARRINIDVLTSMFTDSLTIMVAT